MPDDNKQLVQDITNLRIYEIKLIGKNGQIYQILPSAANFSYESLVLVEGMFEPSVSGVLRIRDLNSTAEQIHASPYDEVLIKLENPAIQNSFKSLKFKVYNVRANGDQIENNAIKEDVNISKTILDIQFTSYEHYLLNYKEFKELAGLTGADIITKIASEPNSEVTGLVNLINNNFFKTGKETSETTQKEMFIEPTFNWIWYKQNQLLYPWSKLNKPMKASQLLQFLAEYSVSSSNPYACNYLFWQDLDRWNFRSVESLLKEPVDRDFYSSVFNSRVGHVYNLQILQESNFLRLLESSALSGKYYLVEPKWDNPYREYLDFNESHSIEEVTYDYFRDYNKWLKVEKYPLIDEDIDTKPTTVNIINDKISGYFEPSYYNRDKLVNWEHHGYTYSNRDGTNTWQPMFDQVELDGNTCRLIQKEIKQKIKDKKIEYASKKNLKEKWKVYKCSICCDPSSVESEEVFNPEFGVAAAGGFTDIINYVSTDGFTGERKLPSGLSLSYNFNEEPFNKTIGELMYLREVPDIQTKYLYDLEVERIKFGRELVDKSIELFEFAKSKVQNTPICSEEVINNTPGTCEPGAIFGPGCFCSQEVKDQYIQRTYTKPIQNRQEIRNSPYFDQLIQTITDEKENFKQLYEKYQGRKAFFISKDIGFTADNPKNLFNVKSIKRLPIRGSKYEKLAHKSVLKELYTGVTGSFNFKGFLPGTTSYYPYEIFYNDDEEINPRTKHPYYDSGYNFEIGYQSNPFFSMFEDIGGPNSGSPLGSDPHLYFKYYHSVKYKKTTTRSSSGYYEIGFPTECIPYDSSETKVEEINEKFVDSNPQKLTKQEIVKKLVDSVPINTSNPGYEYEITKTENSITVIATSKENNCDNSNNTATDSYTFEIIKSYSDNKNNDYLSPIDKGICVLEPFALERIKDFNPIDYINSRNFLNIPEPNSDSEELPKKPIENILEEIESFVRIEFQTPIGKNTLYDFPRGFYDTPGSEYYLPYHVFLTCGPFGTKSVDYNISVIGQDPYGFDVAVKRIKKKKQKLKVKNKALLNNKDYHVVETGYFTPITLVETTSYNSPVSYGTSPTIGYKYRPNQVIPRVSVFNKNFYLNAYLSDNDKYRESKDPVNNYAIVDGSYTAPEYGSFFNYSFNYWNTSFWNGQFNEIFYHDKQTVNTRKNPLSLADSYYEFNNFRLKGLLQPYHVLTETVNNGLFEPGDTLLPDVTETYSINGNYSPIIPNERNLKNIFLPANVFAFYYYRDNVEFSVSQLPIDVNYFQSNISYYPNDSEQIYWLSLFELKLTNRNEAEGNESENETTFYGKYFGVSIWTHPKLEQNDYSCIWTNDETGESEYGIVGPELEDEDSTFDRNFAAQFMVLSRQDLNRNVCGDIRCANPEPVDNSECPEEDPLCNCPCQELRPDRLVSGITGPEPTMLELKELENELKECDLIENVLGEEWLGCDWDNDKSSLNCNCPCIGEKFLDYLKYSETYCTFWQTPKDRPLLRNAQMMQLLSNKIIITLNGDFTLRPGVKVNMKFGNKRYSGIWLVSNIVHDIAKTKHLMTVTLIRDSEYLRPESRADKLTLNTQ